MPKPRIPHPIRPSEQELAELLPPTEVLSITVRMILELSDVEFIVLSSISSPRFNRKANFRTESIVKVLSPFYRQFIDLRGVCKSLTNKGILSLYRPNNWKLEIRGLQIVDMLRKFKGRSKGLKRILHRG